jgi:hypothetical protein
MQKSNTGQIAPKSTKNGFLDRILKHLGIDICQGYLEFIAHNPEMERAFSQENIVHVFALKGLVVRWLYADNQISSCTHFLHYSSLP